MTEPQVWTLVGVFAAALFGLLTLMSTMFVRVLRAEIAAVTARFDGVDARFDGVDARFDGVDARIDGMHASLKAEMTARFEGVDRRIDHLDRDVQMLMRNAFPAP